MEPSSRACRRRSLLRPPPRIPSPRGSRPPLRLVNAAELFAGIAAIAGSRDAGSNGDGIVASRLVNGIEYACTTTLEERRLRAAWKRRKGGGAAPLVLVADDPDGEGRVQVLGPGADGPLRRIRAEALLDLAARTQALDRLEAVRQVAQEVDRLDAEGVAGLAVRGLGTEHLYGHRLPASPRWARLTELVESVPSAGWRELLGGLGYTIEDLPRRGYLARAEGAPAIVVHPRRSAAQFARLDEQGRLPEGALLADCQANAAPWGILAAGTRLRLLKAGGEASGLATRYLELDAAALEPEQAPLLGLLAPEYLAGGAFDELLAEARDHGAKLRERLDRALRQQVLPVLGRELGRWAQGEGLDVGDDAVREELEAAALTLVFRALFLLYAESAGHLPMQHPTYRARSLTRIAERAASELDLADEHMTSLWGDIAMLTDAMRNGPKAWGVPAYNGALFAADGFAGAATLERASIPDAALGPALVALARDPDDPGVGADFSGLEIGHLGHIYEGLLSLRLSVADRALRYDAGEDRYVPAGDEPPDAQAGELLWLTNEGGRKGGGVYYTRSELVRHLIRESVRPAFAAHLDEVRALAESDPAAAAARLFDFYVLDPACGSAHFLVEVVDELADQVAKLLGDVALPAVREALDSLKAAAGATFGAGIEDTALLKRLALKRCVFGVDRSPMGGEIAKVSLWLGSFVPGLSLAYLDHNIQVGDSLVGVARPEAIAPPGTEGGQIALFGDQLDAAIADAAGEAARLRAIEDRTPAEVAASADADAELHERVAGARRVLDLWTAEPLGLPGAREEALQRGRELIEGEEPSDLAERAGEIVANARVLHWPLAFAEAFARERPGFDVVVGNPPWDEVTVEELAFYARYRPGLRALSAADRARALERLQEERPELEGRLEAERERVAAQRGYLGPAGGYAGSAGDPDLYKLFCQRYRQVLRDGGRLGVVLPRGAFLAKGSAGFRRWLFEESAPRRIDFLLNSGRWAFDAEPRYTVALLAAERRAPSPDEVVEVAGVAASAASFRRQSEAPGLRTQRSAFGPAFEVPLLPSEAASPLLAKLQGGPAFPLGGGRWRCFPVREFDETNDAKLWRDATEGRPLWKGESFDQFDPNGAGERPCPATDKALKKARKPRPGSGSLLAAELPVAQRRAAVARTVDRARVAFRDVSRATDSRTVRACLVPPEHFLTNKAPYLAFVDDDPRAEAACVALMNSLAFDWQARRFVETNLNFFVLELLCLPPLDDATFAALADAGARLSCPDERFAAFAVATGVAHGPLDDAERRALRAEIDARVARAWALTADELELVFEDFTRAAVPDDYRDAVRDLFREL